MRIAIVGGGLCSPDVREIAHRAEPAHCSQGHVLKAKDPEVALELLDIIDFDHEEQKMKG
jgi:hypothetical protein